MLLSVANLEKAYGPDIILSGLSFRLDRREKVALVGRNGTGKTTLLKILIHVLEPDSGSVQLARGAEIGFLSQHDPVNLKGTVREEAERALHHSLEIKRRLTELEARLADKPTDEELEEYATLHEHYIELEGYSAERDVQVVLNRMGFAEADFDKPTAALSGGERTRLALARQILEEPDLLILDEPTNHLDLSATEWLEGWLKSYPGAVLLVSHDRAFLENVGDRFLELRNKTVKSYPGPFAKFRKLREEEAERIAELAKRQEAQLAKMDEYVRRFMNSERTAQARGRLKQMSKLEAVKVKVEKAERGIKGNLAASKRSGDQVLLVKKLVHQFGERTLFHELDWTISNGERWGVIGENGSGKSTLVKLVLGQLALQGGTIKTGANVEIGYFAQDAETLDPSKSPIDYMVWDCGMDPGPARDLLGRFLFHGDDVFRPIKTLSGGEQNKLALAKLVHQQPNFLILDEPTNHLDMESREALAEMLSKYKGTLLLVSHDRWLLNQVTNRTLALKRNGTPEIYPGNYESYRNRSSTQNVKPAAPKIEAKEPEATTLTPREISKEIQRLEVKVEEVEAQIHQSESDLQATESALSNLPPDADVLALTHRYAALQEQLEGQMSVWEQLCTDLESMKALQG